MKIAYLTYSDTNQLDGSRLKYSRLFAQVLTEHTVQKFLCIGASASGALKEYKPDLIICHGDWVHHYKIALELGVPYILAQHDVMGMRKTLRPPEAAHEKEMLEAAVGVVFTSEEHQEYCTKKYRVPHSLVVYLRPSVEDLDFKPLAKLPGKTLVYAGGVLPQQGLQTAYGYRVYHEIFAKAIKAGWQVHVYPNATCMGNTGEYERLGCRIHPTLLYPRLLIAMSQYTAGFQGYNLNGTREQSYAYTQACRPNKTWDYLAAGIPTIGFNMGRTARLYSQGGWGVTLESMHEFSTVLERLPVITPEVRLREVIEADAPAVLKFFQGCAVRITQRQAEQKKPHEDGKVQLIARKQILREGEMVMPLQRFSARPWEARTLVSVGKARYLHKFEEEPAEVLEQVEPLEVTEEAKPIW